MLRTVKRFSEGTYLLYLFLCMACAALSTIVLASWCMNLQNNTGGSISYKTAIVQGFAAALGVVMAVLISFIDYHTLARLWPLHAAAAWLLVALTFLIGYNPGDTTNQAWLKLPAGLSLQPSELAKLSFILTFAFHLSKVKGELHHLRTLVPVLVHMAVPLLVIHLQGDDGSMLVFLVIELCMLFCAGLKWRYILIAIGAAAGVSPFIWKSLNIYQQDRILALFHQDSEEYAKILYQQICGNISIGAGQITGRGLFSGDHHYVPLAYNDFFFSYLSECLGFLGSAAVLLLLLAICVCTLRCALRAKDDLGALICTGVFGIFFAQAVINIGMNLTLLPVIGVTLPFFSAGGTSMLMSFFAVGLVLSVYRYRGRDLFDEAN